MSSRISTGIGNRSHQRSHTSSSTNRRSSNIPPHNAQQAAKGAFSPLKLPKDRKPRTFSPILRTPSSLPKRTSRSRSQSLGINSNPNIILSTTPASTAGVENLYVECTKETLYVDVGPYKYQITATYPKSLHPEQVKEFWKNKLKFLQQTYPDMLPAPQEEHKMDVSAGGLSVNKQGQQKFLSDEQIQPSCVAYAKGDNEELTQAVKAESSLFATATQPSFVPAGIEREKNQCYAIVAIQALVNNPFLLDLLKGAASRIKKDDQNKDNKIKAIQAIQDIVQKYQACQKTGKNLEAKEVTKFLEGLRLVADNSFLRQNASGTQQDVDETFYLIEDLILENSDYKTSMTTIQKFSNGKEMGNNVSIPSFGKLDISIPIESTDVIKTQDLLNQHLESQKPKQSDSSSQNQEPESDITKFERSAPPILDLSLKRTQQASSGSKEFVKSTARVGVSGEITLSSKYITNGKDTKYKLSTVLIHKGQGTENGHYISLIAAPNGSYYVCDDTNVTPYSKDRAKTFLKNNAANVTKVIYTKEDFASTVASAPAQKERPTSTPADKSEDMSKSSSDHIDSLKSNSHSSNSREKKELVIADPTDPYKPWNHSPGDDAILHPKIGAVIGKIEDQPALGFSPLNFTNENLTENIPSDVVDNEISNIKTKRLGNWLRWPPHKGKLQTDDAVFIQSREHGKQIYANHNDTIDGLKEAVLAALKLAAKSGGKYERLAIPLVSLAGASTYDSYMATLDAIARFAWFPERDELKLKEIKIVMSQKQIQDLGRGTLQTDQPTRLCDPKSVQPETLADKVKNKIESSTPDIGIVNSVLNATANKLASATNRITGTYKPIKLVMNKYHSQPNNNEFHVIDGKPILQFEEYNKNKEENDIFFNKFIQEIRSAEINNKKKLRFLINLSAEENKKFDQKAITATQQRMESLIKHLGNDYKNNNESTYQNSIEEIEIVVIVPYSHSSS